jgi:hypothetical protein
MSIIAAETVPDSPHVIENNLAHDENILEATKDPLLMTHHQQTLLHELANKKQENKEAEKR